LSPRLECVTWAAEPPLASVSEALGHASTAFTMDTYGHVLVGLQDQAADAIAGALGSTLGE
jgi:hypothetical protein